MPPYVEVYHCPIRQETRVDNHVYTDLRAIPKAVPETVQQISCRYGESKPHNDQSVFVVVDFSAIADGVTALQKAALDRAIPLLNIPT